MAAKDDSDESSMIRKVYMLPRELVDRINTFQQDKNLPSEVEAVRRLLDEALMYRDTPRLIIDRFKERLKSDGIPSSVARDVLVGHPLITNIGQEDIDAITFTMRGGEVFKITDSGQSFIATGNYGNEWQEFPPKLKATSWQAAHDDEIPF